MVAKWFKEIARDILALGGIPFYIIIIARATIGEHQLFVSQMLLAIVVLYVLQFVVKKANLHIARGLIVVFFTNLFYSDVTFTLFAVLLWFAALGSLFYLQTKVSSIVKGILLGIVSTAAAYYLTIL